MFWISFSPIADNAKEFYGVNDTTIAWWLNIGVVGAIVTAIPAIKFMADDTGLKLVCVVCAFAQAFAMVGRLVPYLVGEQASAVGVVVVYVAQLIIGMTGPIVMVSAVFASSSAVQVRLIRLPFWSTSSQTPPPPHPAGRPHDLLTPLARDW